MKTKSLVILSCIAAIVFLSSMVMLQQLNMQDMDSPKTDYPVNTISPVAPKFQQGMVTIKLRHEVSELNCMEGPVKTGIRSLDEKMLRYGVSQLKHRVRFRRDLLKEGMPDLSRLYLISFPAKYNVIQVAKDFENDPNIAFAEPVPVNYLCEIPDDELYDQMYHLPRIMAEEAWDIHKGENGPEVLIGIVDDAVDWRHEDLVDNQWENLGEDADGDGHVIEFNGTTWIFDPDDENGIDDDGNGKTDDFIGWNYINENGGQDNDPSPNLPAIDHGTHCIGIANSRTNNMIDVASIAWNVKFVSSKVCNDDDLYLDYDPYEGLVYLAELGADILTNSWTSGGFSQGNLEVIEYVQALGCIVVAAAGNDNEAVPNFPASYPGVISVAASTSWDYKASFSNYGVGIDICSPGVNILSLKPNNSTQLMSGTSMATPLAAGFLALLKSYYSTWTNEMIIIQALGTADDIDSLNSFNANELGYGRINAYRALSESNVNTQQELKLYYLSSQCSDEDTNGIFSPGETINMGFRMINYAVGVDITPVTFTLSTTCPYINILQNEIIYDLPSDILFSIDSAFTFEINSSLDSTIIAEFEIKASAGIPIPLDTVWTVSVLLNQRGVIVFNGIGTGSSYSGEFIRDYLSSQWQDIFYTQTFPSSLNGFDAAFLSFGNFGQGLSNGTHISYETSEIIADYLYQGGQVFVDCGSFFGLMEYYGYANYGELLELFSLDTVHTPLVANNIDSLGGYSGSLADGMVFSSSTQSPNYYIDIMFPDENGTEMFEESDYGVVGVQAEGEYGQKTVCLSYAIAHLVNDSSGNKELLLARIAEYFGLLSVGDEELITDPDRLEMSLFPNPCTDILHISIMAPTQCNADIILYDMMGKVIYQERNVLQNGNTGMSIDISGLSSGVYFTVLQTQAQKLCYKFVRK